MVKRYNGEPEPYTDGWENHWSIPIVVGLGFCGLIVLAVCAAVGVI